MRVLSTFHPTTTDQSEADKSLDVAVLAATHVQSISQLLKKGSFLCLSSFSLSLLIHFLPGEAAEAYLQFRALYLLFEKCAVSDQQCEVVVFFFFFFFSFSKFYNKGAGNVCFC